MLAAFFAHSNPRYPSDVSRWEPLFTHDYPALLGLQCDACERLDPNHGHLNKVAWWAGKFARQMFAQGSDDAEIAGDWGYLIGLWHDLGKFAPEWQVHIMAVAIDRKLSSVLL